MGGRRHARFHGRRRGRAVRLSIVGEHVRLLFIIPLFFMCESWVAPLMTAFVSEIVKMSALWTWFV